LVRISNLRGLHARAAAKFVQLAASFDAEISVVKRDTEVPGSSILGLMMLAAGPGCDLELRAYGPESVEALDSLAQLIANKFHEE
jgi:phosphocarrier protein